MQDKIESLATILRRGEAVFFGGAGVSTESGIPDFRSENGLYAAKQVYGRSPEQLLSHTTIETEPELFFRYYKESLVTVGVEPNPAHYALAELEKRGLLLCVITQNIDGLHQKAGSATVHELHGSNEKHYCVLCGAKYSLDYALDSERRDGSAVPKCEKCGGIVRPDVVMYEEQLDEEVIEASVNAIRRAKTLLVGGTSLAVYPAAGLLRYFRGDDLVLINKSATPYDSDATLINREPIGATFDAVMRLL